MCTESVLKKNTPFIGIIGGVGPYAGLDFVQKIFANTQAVQDQDHLNCMLVSCPSLIPDRTRYLLQSNHEESENPAFGLFESARCLYKEYALPLLAVIPRTQTEFLLSSLLWCGSPFPNSE